MKHVILAYVVSKLAQCGGVPNEGPMRPVGAIFKVSSSVVNHRIPTGYLMGKYKKWPSVALNPDKERG